VPPDALHIATPVLPPSHFTSLVTEAVTLTRILNVIITWPLPELAAAVFVWLKPAL
jgi:hypothetical protein